MKQLLRTLILALVRIIGLPGALRAARKARTAIPSAPRILLIRPDHLGDLVLTTPVLHVLKEHAPDASITMMVGPWSSEVVARHPAIDRLLPCPFPGFQRAAQKPLTPYILLFSIARQLRRGHYDLAINLRPDFWWGAALLYLAQIPRRIGYAIAPGTPFLTQALPFPSPEMATVSSLRLASAALKALGREPLEEPFTPERYPLQFVPTTEERQAITQRLAHEGIETDTPIVVIHPGTGAAVKLWRVEAWSAIANALPALVTSPEPVRIILTGSKSEQPLLAEIAQGITNPPLLLTDLTVGQLAALLQRAKMVLGVDNGPLHLAVAQNTPTLHIFGPTDPRIFGPWGSTQRHVVLASTHRCPGCPCIPCGRLDFSPEELPQHPCVRLITEQQVINALSEIIQSAAPAPGYPLRVPWGREGKGQSPYKDQYMSYREELLSNVDDYGYPMPPSSRRQLRKAVIRTARGMVGKGIYAVMSLIGACLWLGRLGKKYPPLTPQTFHPKRILVIRLDLIGDLVLSLTVVRALKRTYPEAEIDLLAIPASAKVATFDPNLSEIITYDPNIWRRPKALLQPKNWREAFALRRKLHARHYDLAVSVYANWAATLAVLSGAKRRIGYRPEGFPGFMTDNVPGGIPGRWRHWSPLDNKHEVDYCLELARAAGATLTPADRIPRLYTDEKTKQEVAQLLQREGVQAAKPLIVCHINSNNGQSKRWPLPYWATLLDRLIREKEAQIVLTGAPGDLPQIEGVLQRMREHPINLAGKTSLTQLTALLQQADLLISGDSGPLHMGVACDTPIIGIYGPTNPSLGGPVSPDATVLRSHIWCSPCYNARDTADCRFYTTQCMKNITPTLLFEVVQQKLLDTGRSGNSESSGSSEQRDISFT